MLKKLVLLFAALVLSLSSAFAAVDVNTADQATLESIKGLGPVKSKAIIEERSKNGPFKDADDLARRVKGIGEKSATKLRAEGLTIGASPATGTGAAQSGAPTQAAKPPAVAAPASAAQSAPMPGSSARESKSSAKSKMKKGKAKAASGASGA